ncbi:MAG: hypothetical protein ACLT8E_09185 [Akkermansia sp.]
MPAPWSAPSSEEYSRLTGISGGLDMTGKTVTLKLDSAPYRGRTTGQGVIDADSLTLSAMLTINLSNQGVLDLLCQPGFCRRLGLVLTTER